MEPSAVSNINEVCSALLNVDDGQGELAVNISNLSQQTVLIHPQFVLCQVERDKAVETDLTSVHSNLNDDEF